MKRIMRYTGWFLLMLAVTLAAYIKTFNSPFIFDDYVYILEDSNIRVTSLSPDELFSAAIHGKPFPRFIPNLTFAVNYYFGKYNPFGYHLVNIAVHIICGFLLFFIFKYTFSILTHYKKLKLSFMSPEMWALFCALAWLLHPVNTQAVTYIVQRMTSIGALFYFASILSYICARNASINQKASNDKNISWLYFIPAFIFGAAALASKENTATLPVMIFIYEWIIFQKGETDWLRRKKILLAASLIIVIAVGWAYLGIHPIKRIIAAYSHRPFDPTQRVLTEFRVVVYYFSLFFFPFPARLNLEHDYPLSTGLMSPPTTFLSMTALILIVLLAFRNARKNAVISLALLWFIVTLSIESSIIPIEIIFEHRCYIPFAGLCMAIPMVLEKMARSRNSLFIILSILLVCLFAGTWERNLAWQDTVTILSDCVKKAPQKARPHNNLAIELYKAGDLDGAIFHFLQSAKINPEKPEPYQNIAEIYIEKQMPGLARVYYKKALSAEPGFAPALLGLGRICIQQGDFRKAIEYIQGAIAGNLRDPAPAYILSGIAKANTGNLKGALSDFLKAARHDPGSSDAYLNAANIYARTGDVDKAILYYSKAISLNPASPDAYINLGNIMLTAKRYEEAVKYLSAAIKINPRDPWALFLAGTALKRLGNIKKGDELIKKAIAIDPGLSERAGNMP